MTEPYDPAAFFNLTAPDPEQTVTGHTYTNTRVRGFADWRPRKHVIALVSTVLGILGEYQEYLPMTARQIFYRLVGAHNYPKTENAYKRLLETLNRARRAGYIPFDAIRDDGFGGSVPHGYIDKLHAFQSFLSYANQYTRQRQQNQDTYHEIWVEAAGMVPQIYSRVSEFGIPVYSSGGFNSTTAKHDTAVRIAHRYQNDGQVTRIVHVGDYDPSGVAIVDSLASDVKGFVEGLNTWAEPEFVRAAVTPEQIEELQLPTSPAKSTDRRSDVRISVQAEALSPPQLIEVVLEAVFERFEVGVYEALLEVEARERDELVDLMETQLREHGEIGDGGEDE